MTDNTTHEVAHVDTRMMDGDAALNAAALALLAGIPTVEPTAWIADAAKSKKALQAMRRRTSEARAVIGEQHVGLLDVLSYYALREGRSLMVDGVLVIEDGEYTGGRP